MHVFWDLGPDGNAEHIAEHGLGPEEIEHVLMHPEDDDASHSNGRSMAFGYTPSGQYIAVIYEELDDDTVYLVTAFPVED